MKLAYTGSIDPKPLSQAFTEFMEKSLINDPKVTYIDGDLMAAIDMRDLWHKYPDRVLNSGIMEANMAGVAAGLSLTGYKTYMHTFTAFVTRRAFDQIFISLAYAGKTAHIVGSRPGYTQDFNGGTHMCFEDVALMRCIPGVHIFDITDSAMLTKVFEQTKDLEGVFYYRVPLTPVVRVYPDDAEMKIGKANLLREGADLTIIACGVLVPEALRAADMLSREGIEARVVDMFTIKPLDEEIVKESALKTGAILTAENASVHGGMGESVARCVSENCPVFMRNISVKDEFGEVGPQEYLAPRYGFTAENIVREAKALVALKKG